MAVPNLLHIELLQSQLLIRVDLRITYFFFYKLPVDGSHLRKADVSI